MSEILRRDPTIFVLLGLIALFMLGAGIAAWVFRRFCGGPLFNFEPRLLVPWGAASVLAVIATYLLLGSAILSTSTPEVKVSFREILGKGIAFNLGLIVLIPLLLYGTSRARLGDLGLSTRDWGRNVLRGVVACAMVLPLVYMVDLLAVIVWKPQDHTVVKAFAEDSTRLTALIAGFGAVIAAPATEELMFRAILLATLWKVGASTDEDDEFGSPGAPKTWNPSIDLLANAAVSLLFAGLHSDQWPAPVPLFVLSMALGELYRRSGSLIAVFVMHACFNGLSMAALLIASSFGALPAPG